MKYLTCALFTLLITTSVLAQNRDYMVEINFIDKNSKNHTFQIAYYVDPKKIQFGSTNIINLYKLELNNCEVNTKDVEEQVFASYIEVPNECDALQVFKDVSNHGSEFTFLKLEDIHNKEELISQNPSAPLFIVDEQQGDDVFKFEGNDSNKRNISVQFLIVS